MEETFVLDDGAMLVMMMMMMMTKVEDLMMMGFFGSQRKQICLIVLSRGLKKSDVLVSHHLLQILLMLNDGPLCLSLCVFGVVVEANLMRLRSDEDLEVLLLMVFYEVSLVCDRGRKAYFDD